LQSLKVEIKTMPLLPISYISNFYVVEINIQSIFESLGITASIPVSMPARIIASKFDIKFENQASAKPMIQGKPGVVVQDVTTPYYTYTIEAPLIIRGQSTPPGLNSQFLPYNSLNYLGLQLVNWQWQQLHGHPTAQSTDQALDYNLVVKSYTIKVAESGVTQTLVIHSNILLPILGFSISNFASQDPAGYYDITKYIGRVARNYDIWTNMAFSRTTQNGPTTPFYITDSPVFMSGTSFDITFDIDNKFFVNLGNVVVFMVKGYTFKQSVDIVGFEQLIFTDNYNEGQFDYYYTENTISVGPRNNVLLQYQAPLIVKSKDLQLNAGDTTKTTFDFSMYGTSYGPGDSPYALNDLFYSDIT
jgi:hypothetical protein